MSWGCTLALVPLAPAAGIYPYAITASDFACLRWPAPASRHLGCSGASANLARWVGSSNTCRWRTNSACRAARLSFFSLAWPYWRRWVWPTCCESIHREIDRRKRFTAGDGFGYCLWRQSRWQSLHEPCGRNSLPPGRSYSSDPRFVIGIGFLSLAFAGKRSAVGACDFHRQRSGGLRNERIDFAPYAKTFRIHRTNRNSCRTAIPGRHRFGKRFRIGPGQNGLRVGNRILLAGWKRADGYAGLEPAKRLDYRQLAALQTAGVGWISDHAAKNLVENHGLPNGSTRAVGCQS